MLCLIETLNHGFLSSYELESERERRSASARSASICSAISSQEGGAEPLGHSQCVMVVLYNANSAPGRSFLIATSTPNNPKYSSIMV